MRVIPKRRRMENKTDYKARFVMLKSGVPRLVIRRTNRYVVLQLVESNQSQDKVLAGVSSKALLEKGWDEKSAGSLKSIPAAYLTGMLFAKQLGKKDVIIDMGMIKNQAGSRIYAAVKGLIDGGLKISADPKIFPPQDRLEGKHLSENVQKILNKVKGNLK